MSNLIAMLLWIMLGICFLVWILLLSIKPIPKSQFKQQRFTKKKEEYEPTPSSYPPTQSTRSSNDYGYLIQLLNGDQSAAQRLLSANKSKYPDKSQKWHIDKAVADILRDRR